ncbi:hypothetical protein GCM10022232_17780 [Streptomyces plumbiresistens]|uniref:Transposase n=1 Tax=Streptomyces plumbiresistens TaxID=511811 RepID=A0ABP7QNW7_9ACTN
MLEHGVIVSYETGRRWCVNFGQRYADSLRQYLWRVGDPDGKVLGILVQKRRERAVGRWSSAVLSPLRRDAGHASRSRGPGRLAEVAGRAGGNRGAVRSGGRLSSPCETAT